MTDSYLVYIAAQVVCFLAGYALTDIVFKRLFGVKLIIKNSEGMPVKYRLKNGQLKRISPERMEPTHAPE